jgi:hypothetical protein
VRVLFDHNVPHKLKNSLPGHLVRTADQMGWSKLENGQLLQASEDNGFEVMVTGDKNLSYQQNLKHRTLALVILSTNNWNIIKLHTQAVLAAVNAATPGSFRVVTFER